MRRPFSPTFTGAIAFGLATSCLALSGSPAEAIVQESPGFANVSSVELAPEDAETFAAQVKIVRDAAIEANIDARFGWSVYRWDNTFYFVGSESTLANLEDPGAFARAFEGSKAMDDVAAASEALGHLTVLSTSQSISKPRLDLSYLPENSAVASGDAGGVYVIEQWPKGDAQAAFETSVASVVEMLGQMGGPYPVLLYEDIVGDGGMSFVVPFDNLSNFYGANSLEEGLTKSGMGRTWAEHAAAHSKLISRERSQILMYLPDLSYQPGDS